MTEPATSLLGLSLSLCSTLQSHSRKYSTYPQNLQLLQPLLYQLLPLPLIRLGMMFPKRISCSPPRVFSEIVGGELGGLAEERAELYRLSAIRLPCALTHIAASRKI